jgi:two-component system response regulator FixJ
MQIGDYVVHVVDDEEAVRKSLAFLLATAGFPVRVHESATGFLAAAPMAGKACLVTDLKMPDLSGVELLEKLNGMGVTMPTVVITGHGDVPMAVAAMKAGAVDFIEKPFEKAVLMSAIELGMERLKRASADRSRADEAGVRLQVLTPREREVLDGLAKGLPNKTIAYDLGISPRTVEIHRANLMTKLGVRSLSEALRIAFAAQGA